MLRAGIIGCGRIGCAFDDDPNRGYVSTHAGAYVRTAGVELVALADVDESKLKRYGDRFNVAGRYVDYEEMLDQSRLDILSVCTWNHTHLPIIDAAVPRGVRVVFCEKPIADNLESADRILRLCAEAGVVLLVNHSRRFDPFHQEIASFLRDGRLGRIQQGTAYYTAGLANTGSHLLDLLRLYLGEAVWVLGLPSAAAAPNPADPNIDGIVRFRQGSHVALQACDVASYLIFEVHLLGTDGRLHVISSGFGLEYEAAGPSGRFAGYKELARASSPIETDRPHEFMLHAMTHLVACLEGATPLSSGADGRSALELICALRESAQDGGRPVSLPLVTSAVTIQSR
jgi:predicted dehydrogenase